MGAERDSKGRYLPGQSGCPAHLKTGRPARNREQELLDTMRLLATPEVWTAITKKALEQALRGGSESGAARQWLAKYLLPVPTQSIEVRGTLAELLASVGAADAAKVES